MTAPPTLTPPPAVGTALEVATDADRVCTVLSRRLSDTGHTIRGRPIGGALVSLRASTMEVLQRHEVREVQP